MAITLKKATTDDIPVLLALESSVSNTHTYSPMLEETEWEDALFKEEVFIIQKDGSTVGNVSYEEHSSDHVYISGLVVAPEFQGQGIARAVLEGILEKYRDVQRIDLVVHPDNPALQLYESLGFEAETRKEDFYGDGEPRLILALRR